MGRLKYIGMYVYQGMKMDVTYDSEDEREFCEGKLRQYEQNRNVKISEEKRSSWLINMRSLYRLKKRNLSRLWDWKMGQIQKVSAKIKPDKKKALQK
jgi:hypothetical protein